MASKPVQSVAASIKALSAVGVVAAALIAVSVNVLAARFYERWDWTSAGLYSLSDATLETLRSLDQPIEVIVFLSSNDPMAVSVRHMLESYGAETNQLKLRFVDPDRSPAEFLALQQKYGILAGKTEEGRVVTDASIVIARGERHWFITNDDMVAYDPEDGRARPKLEQALTEGIRNVLSREKAKLCFTAGHQEISIEDGGPNGVGELRYRLEKNNYLVESVDLSAPKLPALGDCRVVAIIGPDVQFAEKAARHVADYVRAGGSALVLANPILDDDNRIQPTGLAPLAELAQIAFGTDFLIERNAEARMPGGLGETFFTIPRPHPITNGLLKGGERVLFRVLISNAQSLRATGGAPQPLLVSSGEAFALKDIRPFVEHGRPVEKSGTDPGGPFTVAFGVELPKPAGSERAQGPRVVIAGSANLAWSRNWRDPTLLGNRLFVESAVSWLASRPALVSVPEKPAHEVGLGLTEESLGEVWRYVLLYMPGSAILIGGFVLYRRRQGERRSRREKPDPKRDEES
jgi:hypothetical protein